MAERSGRGGGDGISQAAEGSDCRALDFLDLGCRFKVCGLRFWVCLVAVKKLGFKVSASRWWFKLRGFRQIGNIRCG